MTLGATKTRLELLTENWAKFEANHEALLDHASDPKVQDDVYFRDDLFTTCQESYLDTKSELMDMCFELEKRGPDSRTETQPSARSRPLPKISLPRFSGKYCDWPPFRDLFTSMVISNSELSRVEMLQYLKTNVSGEALRLIAGIPVTDDNFDRAWTRLISRFENKRALVNSHLDILFALKPVTKKCAKELDQLRTTIAEVLESLAALGAEVDKWDFFLVYFVCRRLDAETHEAWELELGVSTVPPKYSELDHFLENRIRALETVSARTSSSKPRASVTIPSSQTAARVNTSTSRAPLSTPRVPLSTRTACPSCSGQHYIANCPSYRAKTTQERREMVSGSNLCFNCLGQHRRSDCRSTKRCTSCGRDHHSSLHEDPAGSPSDSTAVTTPLRTATASASGDRASASASPTCHAVPLQESLRSQVLLATAVISIVSPMGQTIQARALLDQGSELSFVTESLVQTLRLPRHHSAIALLGIGAHAHTTTRGAISLVFQSRFDSSTEYELEAHILPKLSGKIPSSPVTMRSCPMLDGLQLADPDYNSPGNVDVLLGANIYGQLLNEDVRKGEPSEPVAQSTTLGWIVSGPVLPSAAVDDTSPAQGFFCAVEENLNELVQEFWAQEMVPSPRGGRPSEDDEFCEKLFISTHTRDESGRYAVRLPFKEKPSKLGDFRSILLPGCLEVCSAVSRTTLPLNNST